MGYKPLLLLLFAVFLSTHLPFSAEGAAAAPQACSASSSSCSSLTTYFSVNNIRLSDIATLFEVAYTALLGPNNFNLSLPDLRAQVIPSAHPFIIPQTCGCVGGRRVVTSTNYTVLVNDNLSRIADSYYAGLVNYTEIAAANAISNPDLILPGQRLSIPIPCACSDHGLYLSYQVQPGASLDAIAAEYGINASTLQDINGLQAGSSIQARSLLFVPRPVCKADFSKGSTDSNMTVVDGTYELTANNCVQCRCSNGTLHCSTTPAASTLGASCGDLRCAGTNLTVGESSTSQRGGACNVTSCVYKGYTAGGIIQSKLESEDDPTCPAPPPPEPPLYEPPVDIAASPLGSPAPPTPPTPTPTPPTPASPGAPPPPPPQSASTPRSLGRPFLLLLLTLAASRLLLDL